MANNLATGAARRWSAGPAMRHAARLLALAVLFWTGPVAAQQVARATALVDEAWLGKNLAAPGVRFLDLRPRADYVRGHIPGAISADYSAMRWRGAGNHRQSPCPPVCGRPCRMDA